MSQFSKEELSFVKEVPEQIEIECPVCLNILTDPHLVTCCGHNFCGSCIERVKAGDGSCPMCKKKEYQSFIDKKCSHIINGLEVYCSNKEKGCQWKGELRNMSTHLNKEKREGECQYEEVKCLYRKCQEKKQRRYLEDHEDKECPQRPFGCQYCGEIGTFLSITKDHYEECRQYPVPCPNKCVSTNMPRGSLTDHIKECPLEPIQMGNKAAVHFYTGACGRHMSARILGSGCWCDAVLFAFHKGKFDKYNPKLPNIFLKYQPPGIDVDPFKVLDDTEATYEVLPDDVLDTVTGIDDIPPGVISSGSAR
ncbi:PREDICTED: TNF receptor-associated factor 3-like [Amphimedon queenslandica]|uniref:RING-type domain-containing protein n=1 Tax=Amphimedon queenslandica TaxID=400682 RepID=A0AAN0ILZ4_AMPQE|nr:PREDICTED: TNF receptor-associated factor 3-like [Amphimedon queenslandica]|eukprot:XP_011403757.1 PREDICTED: TNF receptor-associated factor 3-like [Amphimedon queenslandica]